MGEIQGMARRGGIPVTAVAEAGQELADSALFPAGWKCYAFTAPGKGKLHVRLTHANEGWLRLAMTNKTGGLQKGMLQNLTPTGNHEVTFINPKDESQIVYVTVDDPGWMSDKNKPYTLKIDRSWTTPPTPPKENTAIRVM